MNGEKKLSALDTLVKDNTELVPVIQDDGSGGYVNGLIPITDFGGNLANTNLTQTAATNRTYDINGNNLNFYNGQVSIGTPLGSPFATEINGNAGNALYIGNSAIGVYVTAATGIGGYFEGNTYGVQCWSSGGGKALQANSNVNAFHSNGASHIETYSFGATKDASTILQLDSTTQGFVCPRMTTAQINAISTPITGLEVFDTDRAKKVVYNGSYWGAAPEMISIVSAAASLTSGSNLFFGITATSPTGTSLNRAFKSPVSGTIRKAFIRSIATVAGDRSINVYIRINNTTDYLVATVNTAVVNREFINTSLNIPVIENTDTIVLYAVASGGTTDSTGVYFAGQLIVE